ncbi:RNA12 protein-domain-containing protein [Lipomyces oligophaga]|uniref:RNA12 protein-domain-containing protein n=1 Tax=Lipomyces oligophaga TaxID=45792 RepID=UPI0034CFA8C1
MFSLRGNLVSRMCRPRSNADLSSRAQLLVRHVPLTVTPFRLQRISSFVMPFEKQVESTGVIDRSEKEGLLYIDNVYPVRYNIWDFRQHIVNFFARELKSGITDYLKGRLVPEDLNIEIENVIPRLKDGGVYVKFINKSGFSEQEVESRIQEFVNETSPRPWFNPLHTLRAYAVQGIPWIEDLHTFPSSRLRVEFEGPDLDQETLYFLFRRYGLIRNITPLSPASKDLPRYSIIQFVRLRSATSARNCLHGFTTKGTKMHIHYESILRRNWFKEWFTNHPRIVIPVLAALLAALTVVIFDPIRIWFIKRKITKRYMSENDVVKYARSWLIDLYNFLTGKSSFSNLYTHKDDHFKLAVQDRQDVVDNLHMLLSEIPETFIVVYGPRGSGKSELVHRTLEGRANTLFIDCQKAAETKTDAAFIKEFSRQTGYYPVFPWMKNISAMIDLVVQGLIGQKAGFSESTETQFKNILQNADYAIKSIAIDAQEHYLETAPVKAAEVASDDDPEASKSERDYFTLSQTPRPIIVFEHYLFRSNRNSMFYESLAEFASGLVSEQVAHVIVVTDDTGYSKYLEDALPNRVSTVVPVGDASPEVAQSFVERHVHSVIAPNQRLNVSPDGTIPGLKAALVPLGGRMTDLLALVRRMSVGETCQQAVDEMIRQSSAEIVKRFLRAEADQIWKSEQVWLLVKELANSEDIRYNELMLKPVFKNKPDVIQALEHADLITVIERDGRPYSIRAGRPIYRAAFKKLIVDKGLYADQEIKFLTATSNILATSIKTSEEELLNCSKVMLARGADLSDRMKFLADDIKAKQSVITEYDKRINQQKKVLAVEY